MPLITATNLTHAYGSHIVLEGATLSIDAGEKVGMVGRNGGGKSTLMKALFGSLVADSGSISLQKGARVGYLRQDPELAPERTVRESAGEAFAELQNLHKQLNALYEEMAAAEGEGLEKLLRRQGELESGIEAAGGYTVDHRIEATLHGLGFSDEQLDLPVSALSGGQKGRLALARLLLEEPDLLLLDEPTNHLDIEGRRWLEAFLADEFSGAVLVTSHDRWLLDRVVHRIVEVEQGRVREYPGNYRKYVELRRERQLTLARQHEKQLDRIRQEEQFIQRYKTGQRAKQARGRQTRLERFKQEALVERPAELDVMNLSLPRAPRSGEQVIIAEGLSKAYDDLVLFSDLDLKIDRGDRIGIIGPNGIGKSTLIRCLLGEIEPSNGYVKAGSRLSIGYYRQSHEHLDMSLTVWQYLQSVIASLNDHTRASEQQARDLAGAFLFSGGDQEKVLADLSGGERSRAVLAGLVAGAHNLLVLDEPTNHLDIPSAERLEAALEPDGGYDGTLLLISHDRALLESICNQLIIFESEGRVRLFQGTYSDWQQRQAQDQRQSQAADVRRSKSLHGRSRSASRPVREPDQRPTEFARLSLEELESRVEAIESELSDLDGQLADPQVYANGDRVRELQHRREELIAKQRPLEEEWARRAELA